MPLNLDRLDLKLLMQLQGNARISNQEISRRIHLSANAIKARIKRLEDDGYIEKYVTVLSKSKFNRKLECLTGISLKYNNYGNLLTFLECIKDVPQVCRCYHVNNIFDFILHIVAKDVKDYHNCLINILSRVNCVSSTTPFIIFNEIEGPSIIDLTQFLKRFK